MAGPMAGLIARHGGMPIEAPSLREVPLGGNPVINAFVDRLLAGGFDVVVFETGVGVRYLAAAIEARIHREAWLAALAGTKVVARGPKPTAALREMRGPHRPPGSRAQHLARDPRRARRPSAGRGQPRGGPGIRRVDPRPDRRARKSRGRSSRRSRSTAGPCRKTSSRSASAIAAICDRRNRRRPVHVGPAGRQRASGRGRGRDARPTSARPWPDPRSSARSVRPPRTASAPHDLPVDIEPEHPKMGPLVAAVAARWRGVGKAARPPGQATNMSESRLR